MKAAAVGKRAAPATPLSLAKLAVAQTAGEKVDAEAYVQWGRTVSVKVFGGSVESVSVAEPRGIGLRAVSEGRTGYAFSTDLSDHGISMLAERAKSAMEAADPDPYGALPRVEGRNYARLSGLWRPGVSQASVDEKAGLALRAEAAALAVAGAETVEESAYEDEEVHVAVASSLGIEAECEQTQCVVYAIAHAGNGSDRQSGLGFAAARDPGDLDPAGVGQEAADKAVVLVGARPCETGVYDLVLSREVASALLATVAQALSADAVQKGRSVFAGRLGSMVGSALFTLRDDGVDPSGIATAPFDGEGVPQQETLLIEGGTLRSYLYDSRCARREGGDARSTGSARRGSYRTLPRVGPSNLVVAPGEGSVEDLLGRVGEGLYVESIAGLHSGVNPVSGEISLGLSGRLIKGGEAGTPVREVTMATDFGTLLSSICDIGGDVRWIPLYGSVCTPSFAVQRVTVSGR